MKTADSVLLYGNPVISELNRVANFDPLKFLRSTENGPRLDLKYKKLWFRLKYPNGRIRVSNLRITDEMAIIEARVFFDRSDKDSASNYTAQCKASMAPNGDYLKVAQDMAIDRALSDAGFGIQFPGDGKQVSTVSTPPVKTAIPEKKPQQVLNEVIQTPIVNKAPEAKPAQAVTTPVREAPRAEQTVKPAEVKEEITEAPKETLAPERTGIDPKIAEQLPFTFSESKPEAKEEAVKEETPITVSEGPKYTNKMSVDEIRSVMTLEEAENYVVGSGVCLGMKLSEVAEKRPANLRFYINSYKGDDNILRAASLIITTARPELLAS